MCLLLGELFLFVSKAPAVFAQFSLEALLLPIKHRLALEKHMVVEIQFFLIQLVDSLHVFHALLEDLHLGLQLDLLLCLLVRILAHHIFQVTSVFFLELLAFLQVVGLDLLMVIEQLVNLRLVAIEDGFALSRELSLDAGKLLRVVGSHLLELSLH